MRVWHIGCASAFQAEERGSIPLTRSIFGISVTAARLALTHQDQVRILDPEPLGSSSIGSNVGL